MQISDKLIKSCIAQNRRAQKQLYILLLPYLRAIANRYLKDTSYVKDVLQESFYKIFKNIKKFDNSKGDIKTWSTRIVINTAYNYNERVIGNSIEEFDIDEHNIICFPELAKDISTDALMTLLKQMPIGYYEVFNLFIIDGYSHDEIAEILKINESLSRKRMSRARAWIKKTFMSNSESSIEFSSLPKKIN